MDKNPDNTNTTPNTTRQEVTGQDGEPRRDKENTEKSRKDKETRESQARGNKEDEDNHSKDHEMEENWETQVELIYAGHGEWVETTSMKPVKHHGNGLCREPYWVEQWLNKVDADIRIHNEVINKGYLNRWGARIPVDSHWNLKAMARLLETYEDKEVVEWLTYGWPIGRLPTAQEPQMTPKNHKGATDHPEVLTKYIAKEAKYGAIMGPYENIPFNNKVGISPLSTRAKKTSLDRRVILDLSFPVGSSVNDGIPKDSYMGFHINLTFPKVDEFAVRIFRLGTGCHMFKIDLSRYFRQIPLDPGDYSLIGYVVDGKIYFDKVLPMGMRSAPYIAQRITNAIAYIHRTMGYFLLNYINDFVGAEVKERIWEAYKALEQLLQELRVETAPEKLVPPTTRLEFLGITFDSDTMTMEISQEKMAEIKQELSTWLLKTRANRREVESLVGKLQFMAKCVKAGRIFLGRLIHWIRHMDRSQSYSVPVEARKDIAWWARFTEEYNGISLIWMHREPTTDRIIATDACPKGFGGTMGMEYFRARFPLDVQSKNIAVLEMWAVMVALKLWAKQLKGLYFWIHVDNEAVASVLNTGKGRDTELQNALREITFIAATNEFVIKARHIPGVTNRVPDWLSRWHESGARREFREHAKDSGLIHRRINSSMLQYDYSW